MRIDEEAVASPADLFSLAGRCALVTGGCSGLGLTSARALRTAGAKVFVTSNSTPLPSADAMGDSPLQHIGFYDLSEKEGVDALVSALKERTASLDFLINNAGIYSGDTLDECDEDSWDNIQSTNVRPIFFLTRALLSLLENSTSDSSRARVINIGSVVANLPAPLAPYSTSKAAVHHLTAVMAGQLAKRSINVNCIAPSAFNTSMTEHELAAMGNAFVQSIPVARTGSASDIGGTMIFMCSRASEFITGHVLPLDGGYARLRGLV
ncbi:SDR family oxidoreductase [Parasphingopyxis algicola]|uniref:SDR family NAD(P)-dependent oxidoreductase n=1 Tax=Parasphingopyxis algicola TaxID=2026624 RepID=UPI0015A21F54|nr:SDR family oxidoreductase [Parasphingopyxis algicola]QLC26350.1 SDR family oxidoreductase [Parasphingopyxis algicola]